MKRVSMKFLALFLVGVFAVELNAENKPKAEGDKLTLFKVESDIGEKTTNVILSFNKKVTWKAAKLEAHGSFVQIPLPNTFVPNSGDFIDVKSETIKKTVAYQSGLNDGTLRLFVKGKAADVIKNMKADILGDKVIVSYVHQTAEPVVAALTPAAAIAKQPEATKDLLQGKLLTASIFCAVMLIGLLAVYFLRPMFRRRGANTEITVESMKTLSVHALSPKQKLALIQVGDEKILLGLSNESMTYIKTVGEKTVAAPQPVRQETMVRRPTQESSIQKAVHAARRATTQTQNEPVKRQAATSRPVEQAKSQAERILEEQGTGSSVQLSQSRSLVRKSDADEQTAVSDIKKLIRDKLRHMPQIS